MTHMSVLITIAIKTNKAPECLVFLPPIRQSTAIDFTVIRLYQLQICLQLFLLVVKELLHSLLNQI